MFNRSFKSPLRSKLAIGLSLAALSAVPSVASADALAQSYLSITNFRIATGSVPVGGSVTGDGNVSVGLGAATANTGFINGNAIGNFNATVALGAGYVAQTAITGTPIMPQTSYAGGTSFVNGIGIVGAPGFTTGASALSDSTVSLVPQGNGIALTATNTTFGWQFTVVTPTALTINFDATMFLRTFLAGTPLISGNARSSVAWNVAVQDSNGATVFSWAPDSVGAGSVTGAVGGTATNGFSLNTGISSNLFTQQSVVNRTAGGSFQAISGTFAIGGYSLNITHKTDAEARVEVPEPGTLALVGLSLLGLGVVGRRRMTKAAA